MTLHELFERDFDKVIEFIRDLGNGESDAGVLLVLQNTAAHLRATAETRRIMERITAP
jgi:hypothetical protein